jgi:lipid-binding SYLF domain-containing protein
MVRNLESGRLLNAGTAAVVLLDLAPWISLRGGTFPPLLRCRSTEGYDMRLRLFAVRILLLLIAALTAVEVEAQLMRPPAGPEKIVMDATNVLAQSMSMQDGIPQRMVAEAQAIVIVPNMVRGAFVIGAQFGRGVLMMRGPGGAWQPPRMLTMAGGSVGYQIGVQSTDLILVFRTPQSVANLLRGTLKVGVDASAAAGPVGRQASAATDLQMQAEILSYSRARGAFVGVSIDGSSISLDPASDAAYYQPPGTVPASAMQLIQALTAYSNATAPVVAVAPGPGGPPGPPPAMPAPPVVAGSAPNAVEAAREQLDSVSRTLVPILDDNWKQYLALPPEVYVANGVPNPQGIQLEISRYEEISKRPEYASLTSRPEFQDTLKALWKLGEAQAGTGQPLQLSAPPR